MAPRLVRTSSEFPVHWPLVTRSPNRWRTSKTTGCSSFLRATRDFLRTSRVLKLAMTHGGASMIPLVLEKAETYLWIAFSPTLGLSGEPVSLEPEELLEEHPFLVSFDSWETPVARMPDLFAQMAGWGSRYPHHDAAGAAEALEMLESHAVERPTIERLMGGNAIEVFNLDMAAHATRTS